MEQIRTIPKELIDIIPKFDGDQKLLNLYLKKSEYVISSFRQLDNPAQDVYIFHTLTGRLVGKAAHLISEREDIVTWQELKQLLTQHFGDPRSEECIAIELECLKIGHGESYLDFCNRIQNVRSTLFSKINLIEDANVRNAKMTIYNHTSLNVFLYNLPEDMIRVVRLQGCDRLEDALQIVMEEVNFLNQYNSRNKNRQNSTQNKIPQNSTPTPPPPNYKPIFPQNSNFGQNFRFAQPQNTGFNFNSGQNRFPQNQGFRFGIPQNQGFRFGIPNQLSPQGFRFGSPQNQGPRPIMPGQQNFKFGIPQQQLGYKPFLPNNNQFRPNNYQSPGQPQFRFGIPYQQQPPYRHDTDVSMRTAPLKPNFIPPRMSNNLFYANELDVPEYTPEYFEYTEEYPPYENPQFNFDSCPEENCADAEQVLAIEGVPESENFQLQASTTNPPK